MGPGLSVCLLHYDAKAFLWGWAMSEDQEQASGMVILGAVIIFLILRWLFGAADNTK